MPNTKLYMEELILNSSHALIRSNKPEVVSLEVIEKIQKEETRENIGQFGLFDTSSPNYYTYYPDVKPEDLNPQDSEFVYPVFRLLSKVIIKPKSLAIDFTRGNVLKDSMPLLLGQSLYTDHEMITGNVIGSVFQVAWQNAYTTDDGVAVPAGINGVLKIDGKSNPRLARAIMMDPPSIHSSSVSIRFIWEPSHKALAEDEFMNKLGTYDDKGELIRKVATKVMMYFENSLVPHGADPFAKKLVDGKIVLANAAKRMYDLQFSDAVSKASKHFTITSDLGALPTGYAEYSFSDLVKQPEDNTNEINNIKDLDMTFEDLIAELGLTDLNLADSAALKLHLESQSAEVASLTTEIVTKDGEIATLTSTVSERDASIVTLTAERDELQPFKARVEEADNKIRQDAIKFYNTLKGDKADAAILTQLQNGTIESVIALRDDYQTQVEALTPLTCQDCQSTNVTRATAKTGEPERHKPSTMEEIKNKHIAEGNKNFLSK